MIDPQRPRLWDRRPSAQTLAVLAGVATYIAIMGYVALMKFYTFHATYDDLGIENQALWLLTHGGISNYYSSGFANVYPLQYQKPILFLMVPIYALLPGPPTLVLTGTVVLGAAAIPLYFLACRRLGSRNLGAFIALAYLVYFPVASANLFDFHWEDFFPLFFFSTCAAWSAGRRRTMLAFSCLTAMVNPLALVIAVFFLLFTAASEVEGWESPLPAFVQWGRNLWNDRGRLAIGAFLLAVLILYELTGVLYTAGAAPLVGGTSLGDVLFFDVNSKVLLIIYLLVPLAFLPLYRLRPLLTVVPYLAFVFYSTDPANWATFGLMYPLLGAAPLLLALVEGARDYRTQPPSPARKDPTPSSTMARTSPNRQTRRAWRPADRVQEGRNLRWLQMVAISTVVMALVYFPASPINQEVTGGYFAGAWDTPGLITLTAHDQFLWKVIGLIPESDGVLSENGVPQVTGREWSVIPGQAPEGIPIDAVLVDTQDTWFTSLSDILPYANSTLASHTFGIAAEGEGVILLERNYTGSVALYEPFQRTETGASVTAYSGQVEGSMLVGNSSAYSFWYGPYDSLLPGNYTASFELSASNVRSATQSLLTLDVTTGNGNDVLAGMSLNSSSFGSRITPQWFDLNFTLGGITAGVEYRGMFPSGLATLTLLAIDVQQRGA